MAGAGTLRGASSSFHLSQTDQLPRSSPEASVLVRPGARGPDGPRWAPFLQVPKSSGPRRAQTGRLQVPESYGPRGAQTGRLQVPESYGPRGAQTGCLQVPENSGPRRGQTGRLLQVPESNGPRGAQTGRLLQAPESSGPRGAQTGRLLQAPESSGPRGAQTGRLLQAPESSGPRGAQTGRLLQAPESSGPRGAQTGRLLQVPENSGPRRGQTGRLLQAPESSGPRGAQTGRLLQVPESSGPRGAQTGRLLQAPESSGPRGAQTARLQAPESSGPRRGQTGRLLQAPESSGPRRGQTGRLLQVPESNGPRGAQTDQLPRSSPESPECQLMGPVVQARELGSLAPVRAAQVSGVPGLGFPGAAQVPGTPGLGSPGATQGPGAPGLGSPGPACGVTLPEAGSSLKTTRPAKEDAFYSRGRNRNQKFLFLEAEKKKAFWEAHMVQHRHYGARTTCTHLRKKYYWPGMALDVKKWVKMCRKCLDKSIRIAAHNALVGALSEGCAEMEAGSQQAPQGDGRMDHFPLTQEQGLFTFVSLQLLGPLQQTPRGFCFAFVAVDYFTKWVRAAPMHSCSVRETSAQILELVKRFGLPEGIISTASSSFILQINKFLKMALKMQNSLVVKYNPQTDGCLKSIRSFVIRILSLVLTMNPTDWDHHLHKVFFLQNRCSDYSEEEDEDDLRKLHGESPGAAWAPPPQVPELPQPSPESQKEPPAKGRGEDTCLYCCRLPDEGDSDVFAVVQCDRCPAWAHEQCVWRQLGRVDPKISFRCKTCLLAVVGAQPEPQTSRALGAGDGGAGSVGPSWGPGPQHGPGVPGHQLPTFQVAGGP